MTNELKEMLVFLMIISVTAFALVECNGQARKIECPGLPDRSIQGRSRR
jgi:hypothetical protein